MASVEDLWKKLEISKPRGRRSLNNSNDEVVDNDEDLAHHEFENRVADDDSYNDPFDIDPQGDLGDLESELEQINLNPRVSREFSLSKYDIGVRHFPTAVDSRSGSDRGRGRSHEYIYEHEEGEDLADADYFNTYPKKVTFVNPSPGEANSYEDEEVNSNDGADSGHVICDCEDCINQTEAVDCHCENCVQTREVTLQSQHDSSPREVTCDCEECLNHSGDSYVCECENCRTVEDTGLLGLNNNHPHDVCKCPECVEQGVLHQSEMCNCSKCREEQSLEDYRNGKQNGATNLIDRDADLHMPQGFQPVEHPNGIMKPRFKSAFAKGVNSNSLGKGEHSLTKTSAMVVQYDGAAVSKHTAGRDIHRNNQASVFKVDDRGSLSDGSLEGISFSDAELLSESEEKSCECDSCLDLPPPTRHTSIQQPIEPDITRLLEDQLQKAEKDLQKKKDDYQAEVKDLKRENDKQQKLIQQSLSLGPDAKIEATMQHEITRLTAENLDLREVIDKQADQIRKLKKMLKVYAKRMKEGDAAEIQAELEQEETKSVENVAQIKHRDRNYMGMLEYKREDETTLIKLMVLDLKPRVASGLLPGLPAYLLFMCVRHTDYINDDEKVRSFLTSTINGIKKVVKKHHDDIDRVTLWLANTCRFLHNLKQYSGEKTFQTENTSRQNEHCLRNFDLSEYRQVFSDLAVWIYQTLIKLMEATIQPSIVAAVLEHEAIAGLTGSKPSGLRGRSSSRAEDTPEHSLDSLMKALNHFLRVMTQHAVDPELVKQIYRQLYYFIGASALNNLLLRKEMCNWSKGMQVRYNLSHLEQWLRDGKLQESGAGSTLEAIIQASQLLQARKTDADVDSVCDMCSKLSAAQIVKILNLYTPVDDFEERVPISFIRKIQQKLKTRDNLEINNSLLMDLKYSFSVTFPFNPSKIALETIDVPEPLHLGKIVTRV